MTPPDVNPAERPSAPRYIYAQQGLLDRQVLNGQDRMVCKVDDVELDVDEDGRPYVAALLAGPLALGPRIGGRLGRFIHAVGRRLKDDGDPRPARVDYRAVTGLGQAIQVDRSPEALDVVRLESWTRDHVIGKIPRAAGKGSGDAGE
ncbi:hypothetical protein ACGFNU_49505 [Spirillospora sp. NPDC048911]|uniref:hypothetical protein n=1 Tax=Spirillospora sp. NPDC048911 TaxID=3364527 RepID=UPI00371A773C